MNYKKITLLLQQYEDTLSKFQEIKEMLDTKQISIYGYNAFIAMVNDDKLEILNLLKKEGIILIKEGGIYDNTNNSIS